MTAHSGRVRERASSPCTRARRASRRSRGPCAPRAAAWRWCRRWARCTKATEELIAARPSDAGSTVAVVSIFVNPLQFGPNEDLRAIRATLEADVATLAPWGCELVFTPEVSAMYPPGDDTRVAPGVVAERAGGAVRPGHFEGVLTVVSKLFALVRPGRDALRQEGLPAARDLAGVVRDLASSCRSSASRSSVRPTGWLCARATCTSPPRSARVPGLSRALRAGADVAAHGAEAVLGTARGVLDEEPEVAVDYLQLRAPDLGPTPATGQARLLGGGPRRRHRG